MNYNETNYNAFVYNDLQSHHINYHTAAVTQSVKAFVCYAEDWVLESQTRQTYVVKAGSTSSDVRLSTTDVCVTVFGDEQCPV